MSTAPVHEHRATRTRAAAICLILAPLATAGSALSWPVGSDGTTSEELRSAAASPAAYTAAWSLESLGAVLALAGVVALMGLIRSRGRVLGLVGGVLAVGGQVATLTGGGFNAAVVPLSQAPDRGQAVHVLNAFNAQPILLVFLALIWVGLLGTVLLAVGACRARLIGWWILIPLVVGVVVVPAIDDGLYGLVQLATQLPLVVVEVALGVAILRATRAVAPVRAATGETGVAVGA